MLILETDITIKDKEVKNNIRFCSIYMHTLNIN